MKTSFERSSSLLATSSSKEGELEGWVAGCNGASWCICVAFVYGVKRGCGGVCQGDGDELASLAIC